MMEYKPFCEPSYAQIFSKLFLSLNFLNRNLSVSQKVAETNAEKTQ